MCLYWFWGGDGRQGTKTTSTDTLPLLPCTSGRYIHLDSLSSSPLAILKCTISRFYQENTTICPMPRASRFTYRAIEITTTFPQEHTMGLVKRKQCTIMQNDITASEKKLQLTTLDSGPKWLDSGPKCTSAINAYLSRFWSHTELYTRFLQKFYQWFVLHTDRRSDNLPKVIDQSLENGCPKWNKGDKSPVRSIEHPVRPMVKSGHSHHCM